jgi:hypothetical protein
MPRSSKWSLLFTLSTFILCAFLVFSMHASAPPISSSLL